MTASMKFENCISCLSIHRKETNMRINKIKWLTWMNIIVCIFLCINREGYVISLSCVYFISCNSVERLANTYRLVLYMCVDSVLLRLMAWR